MKISCEFEKKPYFVFDLFRVESEPLTGAFFYFRNGFHGIEWDILYIGSYIVIALEWIEKISKIAYSWVTAKLPNRSSRS
jgi:hypothetical protein